MFNETIKKEYIDFYTSQTKATYLQSIFNLFSNSEKEYNKDSFEFTKEEIIQSLKNQNSTSIETLRYRICIMRKYTNWCISNCYHFGFNNYNMITNEDLSNCVSSKYKGAKYISKEIMNKYLEDLVNPCDKFILLALYEGIRGENLQDITELTEDGIDTENSTFTLNNSSKTKVSKELIQIAKQTAKEECYYLVKDGDVTCVNLKRTPQILRPRSNSTVNTQQSRYNRLTKNMLRIKEILNSPTLTIPRIFNSGFVNLLLEKSTQLNIEPMTLLVSEHMEQERRRYNLQGMANIQLRHMFKEYV